MSGLSAPQYKLSTSPMDITLYKQYRIGASLRKPMYYLTFAANLALTSLHPMIAFCNYLSLHGLIGNINEFTQWNHHWDSSGLRLWPHKVVQTSFPDSLVLSVGVQQEAIRESCFPDMQLSTDGFSTSTASANSWTTRLGPALFPHVLNIFSCPVAIARVWELGQAKLHFFLYLLTRVYVVPAITIFTYTSIVLFISF